MGFDKARDEGGQACDKQRDTRYEQTMPCNLSLTVQAQIAKKVKNVQPRQQN